MISTFFFSFLFSQCIVYAWARETITLTTAGRSSIQHLKCKHSCSSGQCGGCVRVLFDGAEIAIEKHNLRWEISIRNARMCWRLCCVTDTDFRSLCFRCVHEWVRAGQNDSNRLFSQYTSQSIWWSGWLTSSCARKNRGEQKKYIW